MTDDADEFIEFLSVDTNEKFIEWARDRLEGLQHLALEYGGDPGFIYTQDGQSYCYVRITYRGGTGRAGPEGRTDYAYASTPYCTRHIAAADSPPYLWPPSSMRRSLWRVRHKPLLCAQSAT